MHFIACKLYLINQNIYFFNTFPEDCSTLAPKLCKTSCILKFPPANLCKALPYFLRITFPMIVGISAHIPLPLSAPLEEEVLMEEVISSPAVHDSHLGGALKLHVPGPRP